VPDLGDESPGDRLIRFDRYREALLVAHADDTGNRRCLAIPLADQLVRLDTRLGRERGTGARSSSPVPRSLFPQTPCSPASTRSAVYGTVRRRAPVASKMA